MKTAIYIEDGTVQLVITPESDFEKAALKSFSTRPLEARVFSGGFYDSRGGWVRQSSFYPQSMYGSARSDDTSLILRMSEKDNVPVPDPEDLR